MIAIFLDYKLERFSNKIKYVCDFVFSTLGYNYRFIRKMSELDDGDILFLYSLIEPTQEEIQYVSRDRITFYSPFYEYLYQSQLIPARKFSDYIKEVKFNKNIPIISEKDIKNPISFRKDERTYLGYFHFDILGNIFYHMLDHKDYYKDRNNVQHFKDTDNPFHNYTGIPYINELLNVIDLFFSESAENSGKYLVKKSYWPNAEKYAVSVSHNVLRLQKWSYLQLFNSFFTDFFLFFTFKWKILAKNFVEKIKYIVTNFEPYWNFDFILKLEETYKIKSTFFFCTETKAREDADYSLDDPDILKTADILKKSNKEISLLGSYLSYKNDILDNQKYKLMESFNLMETGVRQNNYRFSADHTPEFHQKLKVVYDSSISNRETSGFSNGIAFPYKHFSPSSRLSKHYNYLEMPVMFNDEVLKISPYKCVSFERAKEIVKRLFSNVEKTNGMLNLAFNISNFTDIPYGKKLYTYIIEYISQQNAFQYTLMGLAKWWKKRAGVEIIEYPEEVIVHFTESISQFSLQIFGNVEIIEVRDVESKVRDRVITLLNLKKDSTARIILKRSLQDVYRELKEQDQTGE